MKVCIFTGSRAEYGLLKPLIEVLNKNSKNFSLQAIVSGMHLSPEFGCTAKEIDMSPFDEVCEIEVILSSDSAIGIAKSVGLGLISYSEALNKLKPDLVIGLGDRFELLSVVIAANLLKIPVAHIHGGELTFGAYDDAFRHSITKMSNLHFASSEIYRKRIIQLGENPENVFNVGALGLDNIKNVKHLSLEELGSEINFQLSTKFFLVTIHPETRTGLSSEYLTNNLLKAFDFFAEYKLLITKPNADNEGRKIINLLENYVKINPDRAILIDSLGQLKYLSAMKYATLVVGNSSSGIIEAPFYKVPTVNIGSRQIGRYFPKTIIQCDPNFDSIKVAIANGLSFDRSKIGNFHFYGDGSTSNKIMKILSATKLESIKNKTFFDITYE